MAVSILERPKGYVLDTCVSATINEDYNGLATVNKTAHGFTDGDVVYIQSNVEDYSGFWPIDVVGTDEFTLVNPDGTHVAYLVDAEITYCPSLLSHGWSCVHLPITYKLSNTRWPVNSVDTARTILSISDDNGHVNLTLSATLGTIEDFSFVKISNANDSDFDGVWQVIDKLSTTSITINLLYPDATASGLAGATIQLYYNNYTVTVRVYGGLNASHQWTALKPYELLATLNLIPDTDNTVKFSINEILKSQIEVRNNLLLATLPNNLDFWTGFYIDFAESYDSSDGYTLGTTESSFNSDKPQFEGYAVNSKLAFKNIHSGYLSDYLMTNNAALFLTLFTISVLFGCTDDYADCYQDISFINPYDDVTIVMNKKYYSNGVLQSTVETQIYNGDKGIIRTQVEADCDYDRVDMYAFIEDLQVVQDPTFTDDPFDDWSNQGAGQDWSPTGSVAIVNVLTGSENSKELTQTFPYIIAGSCQLKITTYVNNDSVTFTVKAYFEGVLVQTITSFTCDWATPTETIVNFTASGNIDQITIECDLLTGTDIEANVDNVYLYGDVVISETKQFKIDCGCADQDMRLTWLNNLPGMDYWKFTAESEHIVEVGEALETIKNIFPNWPNSYGAFADTIRKQTARQTFRKILVTSQYLTQDEADAISFIKSSVVVQKINSRQDRRMVIVDADSFTKYKDGDQLYSISFTILYTDDIEVQSV